MCSENVQHSLCHYTVRYSILPALSLDGIIALDVLTWPYKRINFLAFIDLTLDQMNPFPHAKSVIIMDNASIHKGGDIEQKI